ncbi:hypothetical protein PAMC26510_11975 [Caballeronia sordidicola]|uniref:Uncharacterized protein n=1 Tax=Caballeronia sordidicola TaxID=196367 RepID=A0A242MYS0_CABSO|nr:hypothetical protein PAMC26510_11975 [Caballeronia sordidicola]
MRLESEHLTSLLGRLSGERNGMRAYIGTNLDDSTRANKQLAQKLPFDLGILAVFEHRFADVEVAGVCEHPSMPGLNQRIGFGNLHNLPFKRPIGR